MRARAETTCTRALAASAFPGRPLLSGYICEAELAAKASMCPVHNSAGHGPNLPKAALTIAQRRQSKTQRANNKAQIRRRALTPSSGSPTCNDGPEEAATALCHPEGWEQPKRAPWPASQVVFIKLRLLAARCPIGVACARMDAPRLAAHCAASQSHAAPSTLIQ